jgi:hypothetical protein
VRNDQVGRGVIGRLFDSAAIALAVTLFCCVAFDVWTGSPFRFWIPFLVRWTIFSPRKTAIICAYSVFALGMIILTNIIVLSWMHQQRDRHLDIERRAAEIKVPSRPRTGSFAPALLGLRRQLQSRGGPVALTAGWRIAGRLAVPVAVLYLVSVLGFAHLIYPFIPVEKAGGNYSVPEAGPVYVVLNSGSAACVSATLAGKILPDEGFYVLEETSDWLYLAPADTGNGPACWKWGVFCKKAEETKKGRYRPDVYQVDRRCIAAVGSKPW